MKCQKHAESESQTQATHYQRDNHFKLNQLKLNGIHLPRHSDGGDLLKNFQVKVVKPPLVNCQCERFNCCDCANVGSPRLSQESAIRLVCGHSWGNWSLHFKAAALIGWMLTGSLSQPFPKFYQKWCIIPNDPIDLD